MVQAIGAAVSALSGIVGGAIGGGKSRAEEEAAREEMAMNKAAYANLDTSNPYANVQNTYEDLTVNQQQAQFEKEMAQQQPADTLSRLGGAAGGSGALSPLAPKIFPTSAIPKQPKVMNKNES